MKIILRYLSGRRFNPTSLFFMLAILAGLLVACGAAMESPAQSVAGDAAEAEYVEAPEARVAPAATASSGAPCCSTRAYNPTAAPAPSPPWPTRASIACPPTA